MVRPRPSMTVRMRSLATAATLAVGVATVAGPGGAVAGEPGKGALRASLQVGERPYADGEAIVRDDAVRSVAGVVAVRGGDGGEPRTGVEVEVHYDGAPVARATTGAGGKARFRFDPPEAPAGLSEHALRVVCRHAGADPADHTWPLVVRRDPSPVAVDATTPTRPLAVGLPMTVEGRVYVARAVLPSAPVRAAIEVLSGDGLVAAALTDDAGRYRVAIPHAPAAGELTVRAQPLDRRRYRPAATTLRVEPQPAADLVVEMAADRVAYGPDGTIVLAGRLRDGRGAVDGDVEVDVVRPGNPVTPLLRFAAKGGEFREEVPVRRLWPKNALDVDAVQEGVYALVASATGPGGGKALPARLHVTVQETLGDRRLGELEVRDVRGRVLVQHVDASGALGASLDAVRTGRRLTQGAVLATGGPDASAVLWLPCGSDGSGVEMSVRHPTTLRIGSFSEDASGRARLRVFTSEPSALTVQTRLASPTSVVDAQIVTPSAVATSSTPGSYDVVVDEGGATTVAATSGSARFIPRAAPQGARTVEPAQSATTRTGAGTAAPTSGTPGSKGPATPGAGAGADAAPKPVPTTGPDLADGRLSSVAWVVTAPAGASAKVVADRLVLDVPKASDGEAAAFSRAAVEGDFDLSVDYELTDWTPGPTKAFTLKVWLSSDPHPEAKRWLLALRYADEYDDSVVVERPDDLPLHVERSAAGSTGTLRVSRAGSSWTVRQKTGDAWQTLATFSLEMPSALHLGFGLERQGETSARATVRPRWTR